MTSMSAKNDSASAISGSESGGSAGGIPVVKKLGPRPPCRQLKQARFQVADDGLVERLPEAGEDDDPVPEVLARVVAIDASTRILALADVDSRLVLGVVGRPDKDVDAGRA